MPFDAFPQNRPLSVAVVGTGIAGMSAAWLLSQRHSVTVYEKNGRIGGHTNTVEVPGLDGPIAVDTGFIVYNEANYPNLVALLDHLGVPTKLSDMSFGVSINDGALEYAAGATLGLFAQRRNALRPRFWRMLRDIQRFHACGPALVNEPCAERLSLGDFLERERFSDAFIYDHLLPMAAAIGSPPVADMRDYPAVSFVRFLKNHGLMQVLGRPPWRTVDGGSREYVRRLTAAFTDRIRLASGVEGIRRTASGVFVRDENGIEAFYDHVVVATHANQALAMLSDPSPDERSLLGAFKYTDNAAVLHQDASLMPRRRSVWSSWNYMRNRGDDGCDRVSVTYWMNALQGIDRRVPLFVSLNPHRDVNPSHVLATFEYSHPSFDVGSYAAQRALWGMQGVRNTWFCGSYLGDGFHEDGLQAGLAVAEACGGLRRPWRVAGESDRISLPEWAQAA